MLKSCLNIIDRLLNRKHSHKARSDYYWTDFYPSPEPSYMKKAIDKTCNWVYGKIDSFFQGSAKGLNKKYDDNINDTEDVSIGYSQVWELNQGIVDIAINDLKGSLNWLLPGFIKRFANYLYQQLLLYFFTDTIIEQDTSDWGYKEVVNANPISRDKGKIIYAIQEFREGINYKFLSINEWWVRFFYKLSLLLRFDFQKKTYYLLGYFAPQGYDYSIDNQNCMIRGPDETKLNPTLFFHKRI